jgi:hypothetical protein
MEGFVVGVVASAAGHVEKLSDSANRIVD